MEINQPQDPNDRFSHHRPEQQSNSYNQYHQVPEMGMMDAVKACFDKYAEFEGRSRRSEYWYFRLFQFIVFAGFGFLFVITSLINEFLAMGVGILMVIFLIALIIPTLAVTVRRFHDAGQSGWLLLLDLFCTSGIISIIFGCIDSQHGHNQYGPNPKGIGNDW